MLSLLVMGVNVAKWEEKAVFGELAEYDGPSVGTAEAAVDGIQTLAAWIGRVTAQPGWIGGAGAEGVELELRF
jgi:hypothetical protein